MKTTNMDEEYEDVIAERYKDEDFEYSEIKPAVRRCKECGEVMPLVNFRMGRHGRVHTCNKCTTQKRRANKEERVMEQRKIQAMHDAEFEGKQPCEVLQMMGRAKRWLEARGYEIVLRGSLMVKKDVKFE